MEIPRFITNVAISLEQLRLLTKKFKMYYGNPSTDPLTERLLQESAALELACSEVGVRAGDHNSYEVEYLEMGGTDYLLVRTPDGESSPYPIGEAFRA